MTTLALNLPTNSNLVLDMIPQIPDFFQSKEYLSFQTEEKRLLDELALYENFSIETLTSYSYEGLLASIWDYIKRFCSWLYEKLVALIKWIWSLLTKLFNWIKDKIKWLLGIKKSHNSTSGSSTIKVIKPSVVKPATKRKSAQIKLSGIEQTCSNENYTQSIIQPITAGLELFRENLAPEQSIDDILNGNIVETTYTVDYSLDGLLTLITTIGNGWSDIEKALEHLQLWNIIEKLNIKTEYVNDNGLSFRVHCKNISEVETTYNAAIECCRDFTDKLSALLEPNECTIVLDPIRVEQKLDRILEAMRAVVQATDGSKTTLDAIETRLAALRELTQTTETADKYLPKVLTASLALWGVVRSSITSYNKSHNSSLDQGLTQEDKDVIHEISARYHNQISINEAVDGENSPDDAKFALENSKLISTMAIGGLRVATDIVKIGRASTVELIALNMKLQQAFQKIQKTLIQETNGTRFSATKIPFYMEVDIPNDVTKALADGFTLTQSIRAVAYFSNINLKSIFNLLLDHKHNPYHKYVETAYSILQSRVKFQLGKIVFINAYALKDKSPNASPYAANGSNIYVPLTTAVKAAMFRPNLILAKNLASSMLSERLFGHLISDEHKTPEYAMCMVFIHEAKHLFDAQNGFMTSNSLPFEYLRDRIGISFNPDNVLPHVKFDFEHAADTSAYVIMHNLHMNNVASTVATFLQNAIKQVKAKAEMYKNKLTMESPVNIKNSDDGWD